MIFRKLSEFSSLPQIFTLSSGLPLVVHSFPATAIGLSFMIKCGPIIETPEQNGISHFLEHMLFRGTKDFPSAEKLGFALDEVGSDANAATFSDMTIITQRVLPEAIDKALFILRGMVTQPVFSGLDAERQIILEECLEDMDEDGQIIAIDQLSSQLIYGNHPYSFSILGNPDRVRSFSKKDLQRFHEKFYHPSLSVLCLSGKIQPSQAKKVAEKIFGNWTGNGTQPILPEIEPTKVFKGPKLAVVDSPRSQIQTRISFKALPFSHPDYYVTEAIARFLDSGSGSPLRNALQEKGGYCYSLGVGVDAYENDGAIHIDMSLQPDRLVEALKKSLHVFKHLRQNGLSKSSLEHIKKQYVKVKRFAAQDLWEFCGKYAFKLLFPSAMSLEAEFEKTCALKRNKINLVMQQIFRGENLGITLVGPVTRKMRSELREALEKFTQS